MRASVAVQTVVFLIFVGVLVFVLTSVETNWADWIVFGVIVMAAFGGAVAVNWRRYPHANKARRFTRDSESRWQ
jgi:hypothetical protein